MCGIFGKIGKRFVDINKCIQSIQHRGPDACHTIDLGNAKFAHCRLSIIDIDRRADQPMCDATKRYWIVYNGEVYNYLEIKQELLKLGYIFSTKSDTEVILNAYIEWGEKFMNRCNGMWSIAIWDSKERKLFLSRDRFGVKPLYYYVEDGEFYFASEMKAFFPIMKRREINRWIFDEKAWFQYEGTSECVIRNIRKIPAGHYGIYENKELSIKRWWTTLEHIMEVPQNYEEQVEIFRELFLDACRIRMRSDVSIGTALSGGVDSSAVAGVMSQISQAEFADVNTDWQNLFVARLPGTFLDETFYARKAADHIGVGLQEVIINCNITEDELLNQIYLCEDPYPTSPIPFMQTYGAMRSAGIKVTLDGHGADELFLGYPYDLFGIGTYGLTNAQVEDVVGTYNNIHYPPKTIDVQTYLEETDKFPRYNRFKKNEKKWKSLDSANKRLYYQTHVSSLPTLLRMYDRYSMANGVEIRMPFLDYRIVSFAFSIPWTSKVQGGYSKRIVRDMASHFMDKEVIYRKSKIGFNSPMTEWFRGDMKEFVLDTVHSRDFMDCSLVNSIDAVVSAEMLINSNKPTFFDGEHLWEAIMPYLWQKAVMKA